MRNVGQTLSRQQLVDGAWDSLTDVKSNIVDVYIAYLRQKLAPGFDRDDARRRLPHDTVIARASLRTRLALLYAALAVVVLAISLFTVYGLTRHETLNRVDDSLRVDARNLGSRAEGSEHGSESPSTERFVNAREAVAAGHLLALVDDHKIVASNSDARLLLGLKPVPRTCWTAANTWPRCTCRTGASGSQASQSMQGEYAPGSDAAPTVHGIRGGITPRRHHRRRAWGSS